MFELAVAVEVFGLDRRELSDPWYRFRVVATGPDRPEVQGGGFALLTRHRLDALADVDTLVVPAWDTTATTEPEVLDAVRAVHDRGGRVVALCSGAFLLAEAGLLDGRRATTHWMYADALARRFPAVEVDPDVLYVDGGDGVFTSAGTAAGIDLCLHLVRADLGAEVANAVARRMVVPPHRTGGQAQYVAAPVAPARDGGDGGDPLPGTLDWALEHLDEPLTVEILARRALQSPRTFARRFRERTGTTPLQWLLRQRILAAQQLLEAGGLPVELVAQRCGFGSAAALRSHFRRHVGTTPLAYRAAFRRAA